MVNIGMDLFSSQQWIQFHSMKSMGSIKWLPENVDESFNSFGAWTAMGLECRTDNRFLPGKAPIVFLTRESSWLSTMTSVYFMFFRKITQIFNNGNHFLKCLDCN
jgi:hypothetical protein